MAINRPLQKNANGVYEEIVPLITGTGVPDANKLVQTNAQGVIDVTLLPTGVGADVTVLEADEALFAGAFVNIFDDGGTPKVRLADSGDESTRADGFVLEAYLATENATIYRRGTNDQLAALVPASRYFLGLAGLPSLTPPANDGDYCQPLGIANAATEMDFERVNGTIIHP